MAAISVEKVSKRYRKGTAGYRTLREDLYNLTGKIVHLRKKRDWDKDTRYMWALRDISFRVEPGEKIGIIGRNGSGKTTTLRLLAGITKPTEGSIAVQGRLGVLIELQAGFHPELTGRENVYLNGAIMGMSRNEIRRKFDEIVSFAEVEDFIDTPVKRYSSGMYVRLGFAVAAHLEPEILLVDEVLAVGDAAFRQKCLGKMGAAAQEGRTVVFVSHNMAAIRDLCPKCLWIDGGRIREAGPSSSVVASYLQASGKSAGKGESSFDEDPRKDFQLLSARLADEEGNSTQWFDCDRPIIVDMICRVHRQVPGLYGYFSVSTKDGTEVMVSDSYDTNPQPLDGLSVGTHSLRIRIPARTLASGEYDVYLNFASPFGSRDRNIDSPGVVGSFRLDDSTSRRGNQRPGFFSTQLSWDVSSVGEQLQVRGGSALRTGSNEDVG